MLSRVRNLSILLKQKGVRATLNYVSERVQTIRIERRLGIESVIIRSKSELAIENRDYADYVPVAYCCLIRCLKLLDIRPNEDVLLDYGSGKGRVVLFGATRPFRRVVGVELSSELIQTARANLEACRPQLHCKDVTFIKTDATTFPVPPDVSIVFFINPFHENIMETVLKRMEESLFARPRQLTLAYVNANEKMQQLLKAVPWLEVRAEYDDWCMPGVWRRVMILKSKVSSHKQLQVMPNQITGAPITVS